MKVKCTLLAILLCCAGLGSQQTVRDPTKPPAPRTGSAVLGGVVVTDEASAQPLRRARVILRSSTGDVGRTVTTDDAGRFTFRDVPAGRYSIAAVKPGFVDSNYGARRPGRPGTSLAVEEGQKTTDLVIRVARGAVVTGTVRDQSGTPLPGVDIRVMGYGYSPSTGARMLATENSVTTDDRGVFRGWGLPPGEYVVVATPGSPQGIIPGGRGGPGSEGLRRLTSAEVQRALSGAKEGPGPGRGQQPAPTPAAPVTYSPVFHPDAISLADAVTIALAPGEERIGVDITLRLVPTARIDGSVTLPPGVQRPSIAVTLTYDGTTVEVSQGFGLPQPRTTRLDPSGQFSFVGDHTGSLHSARENRSGEAPGARGRGGAIPPPPSREASSEPSWWALAEIDVDGRDLTVPLDLQPSMTVVGRVVFEGSTAPPETLTGLRGFLLPRGAANNLGASAAGGQVDKAGNFRFTGVTPDTYRLLWTGGPKPWVRKTAMALGVDLIDNPLQVKSGMTTIDLTITYTDRPTEIGGTLQDASGRAATDYFIVVFSSDRALWGPRTRRVQTVRPATDGSYIAQLPPGDYFVAALLDLEPGDTNDAAFLEQLIPAPSASPSPMAREKRRTSGSKARTEKLARRTCLAFRLSPFRL